MTGEGGGVSRPGSAAPREGDRALAAHLERALGDLSLEAELAATPRATVHRVRLGGRDGRACALKIGRLPLDADELPRFRHEVRLLCEARHPNVVEVFEWGVLPGDYPFLVMELLATGGLAELCRTASWSDFYALALQAAAGLAHIHRHGVLHLDLKPLNLGLASAAGGQRQLKVLDFGLAQAAPRVGDRKIRGTLAYTAPEILLQDGYDGRADLYSLGLTLYELATGTLPSAGGDEAAIRFHLTGEVRDPRELRPDLPAPLAEILLRLLRRRPSERFASAARLLAELAAAAGRPIDPAQLAFGEGSILASALVGREAAMAELRAALAEAAAGRGAVVLVEGPDGIGKSRLLREFRLLAALEGARIGVGRAGAHLGQPLAPLAEALRALGIGQLAGDELATARSAGEEDSPALLGQAVARALADLPHERTPLVLLLEDLHLAGPAADRLLAELAPPLAASPALLVASRRAPEADADPSDLLAAAQVRRLELAPLTLDEVAALAASCLGEAELPPALVDWVASRSAGLPGRVGALLRHLIDERVLRWRDGRWKPSLPALTRLAASPGGAEAIERQRLAGLAPAERELVEIAALAFEPLRLELVAELVPRPVEELYQRLNQLCALRLLDRLEEPQGVLFALAQSRLRGEVERELPEARRRRMHLALGETLERRWAAGARELAGAVAEHFWQAGERGRALPFLLESAADAAAAFGHGEAARRFARAVEVASETGQAAVALAAKAAQAEALAAAGEAARALRLLDELLDESGAAGAAVADPVARAELLAKSGRLHARLGDHEAARQAFALGLRQVAEAAAPELEIELLHGEAMALRDLGDAEGGFRATRAALRRAARLGLPRVRANLLNTLGMHFYSRGDWRRAGRLLRRGLGLARQSGERRLEVKLRNNLGNVEWKTGGYDRAEALYRENLAYCERVRDPWGELSALNNLGILAGSRGDWRGAREPLTRAFELARRLASPEAETLTRLNLAEVEEMLGDWTRARRLGEQVLRLLAENPDHANRLSAAFQLASLARKRGDHEEARTLASEALAGAERIDDGDLVTLCHWQLGLVDRDRERYGAAAGELERARARALAEGTHESLAKIELARADLALRQGDRERARALVAEARRAVEAVSDRAAEIELLGCEARLAFAAEESGEAEERFAAAVALAERLELPFEYARALSDWGVRTAEAPAALERLDRALVAFDRLGAAAEAERARGAMELVRQRQRFEHGRRGTPGLWEVAKLLNSTLDQREVLSRTMDLVLHRLRAERGMIVLWNALTRDLEVAVARNLGESASEEGRQLSETVVRRVLESREPILAVDALADARFAGAPSIVASHIVSILCVPLAFRDRLLGAIYLDHRRSRDLFAARDLEFLHAFADQAAIALENARLFGELAAARERLTAENEALRSEVLASRHLGALVGKSQAIAELKQALERIAASTSTVLVRGESGTGKGLVARLLHGISPRRAGPFVQFNCAALPETLVESELFGHERGAFTGAVAQKPGRFELAHGGTIFLDEIGKVSRAVQAKLLRVVEDKEFERVGGTKTLKTDVRIVAATNLDLEEAIAHGEFREDLYYRLNILPIVLPPLRERRADLPYLVEHFLAKIARDLGQPPRGLEPSVLDLFAAHRWPGNVRELEAAIHRALVLSSHDPLRPEDFSWLRAAPPAAERPPEAPGPFARDRRPAADLAGGAYERALGEADRRLLAQALAESGGRIREAARRLGIARNTLKARMKRYGLEGHG